MDEAILPETIAAGNTVVVSTLHEMCWFETDECDVAWWAAFRAVEGVVFVEVDVLGSLNDTGNAWTSRSRSTASRRTSAQEPRASAS